MSPTFLINDGFLNSERSLDGRFLSAGKAADPSAAEEECLLSFVIVSVLDVVVEEIFGKLKGQNGSGGEVVWRFSPADVAVAVR